MAKVEVMFVLSGNAEDRGREAAKLYKEGWAERIVCTGEEDAIPVHWPDDWLSMGEFTKYVIVTHGVDSNRIELIPNGTSTWEEHLAIVKYCKEQNLKKIMIVTSRFHTNRVRMVFDDPLEEAGIEWVLRGAVDSEFNESEWWEKEEGMIFVTNEYLKTIYYWWKY